MDSSKILDWGFNGCALVLFCIVVYLIARKEKALCRATATGLLFVFCALMGNPDRFETFKFSYSGVEATARDVIQKGNSPARC
jgi:hypothetical protein